MAINRSIRQLSVRLFYCLVAGLIGCALLWGALLRGMLVFAPYWFDEVNTIYFISQPFIRMLQFVMTDVEVPAYYVVLYGWVRLFTSTAAATAVLSLGLEVGVIFLLYRFGRSLFSPRVAQFSILLYFVSYSAIYYSTETRPYSLLLIATISSLTALWRLLHGGTHQRWHWLEYIAASILGAYTHFIFLFLIYAQNVAVVWFVRRHHSALDFRRWMAVQFGLMVAGLPLLVPFLSHLLEWANRTAQTWTDIVATPTFGKYVEYMVVGQFFYDGLPPRLMFGFSMLIGLAIMSVLFRIQRQPDGFMVRPRMPSAAERYLLILVLVPFLTFLPSGFGVRRYMIILAPLLCLLLAVWFLRWRPVWWGALTISVFAVAIVTLNAWYFVVHFPNEARYLWPSVSAYFSQPAVVAAPGPGLVLLSDWDTERQFRYYYHSRLPVRRFFPTTLVNTVDPELSQVRKIGTATVNKDNVEELIEFIRDYRTIWLVTGDGTFVYDPTDAMPRWMDNHCDLESETFFGGGAIRIRRYGTCSSYPRTQERVQLFPGVVTT